jgi:hypothetical protein
MVTTRAITDISSVPNFPYSIFYQFYDMYIGIQLKGLRLGGVALGTHSFLFFPFFSLLFV